MNSDSWPVVMPSQTQCRYSSIRRRSTSVLGSSDMSAPPRVGVAIDLITGAPQTGDAIAVDVALPSQELIDRDVVKRRHASSIDIQPPRTPSTTAALRRTVHRCRG